MQKIDADPSPSDGVGQHQGGETETVASKEVSHCVQGGVSHVHTLKAVAIREEIIPHFSKGRREGDGGERLTTTEEVRAYPPQRRPPEVYPS